jgi:enamine deaminase RidA (YjgF/YER057c/UK114 family)
MVYVSGTTGFNPETMSFPDSVEEQAELCFHNIQRALVQADSHLDNLLRVRVYVASREEFDRIKPIIKKYCDAARPANTTIICDLAEEQMRVEVEVTAKTVYRPQGNER